MLGLYDYVMDNINQFASLGDFYDDKNNLVPEVSKFLAVFGGEIDIQIYPYSILEDFQEKRKDFPKDILGPNFIIPDFNELSVIEYLKKDGIFSYSVLNRSFTSDHSKEEKRKDLIWQISIKSSCQPQFSQIKRIDFQVLKKFYIPCTIEKPNGNYLHSKDLNDLWDDLHDDCFISISGIMQPKILKLYEGVENGKVY
jgi:hypothetical protein